MECLNNIFLSLATSSNPSVSADVEAGNKVWNGVWSSLGVVGTELGLGQERRMEMWEIGVGVLWGVAVVWKGTLVSEILRRTEIMLCNYLHSMRPRSRYKS